MLALAAGARHEPSTTGGDMDWNQERGPSGAAGEPAYRTPVLLASLAGLSLCGAAALLAASSPFPANRGLVLPAHVLVIAVPLAAGLYGLHREPGSRFARLLVLAGLFWSPTMLAESGDSLLYSV